MVSNSPAPFPQIAPFLCNSKLIHSKGLSAPISPLESALTDCSRFLRISLKINGWQVLYNQHLRVFSSQVLYIQQIHKNMGEGEGSTFRVTPRLPRRGLATSVGCESRSDRDEPLTRVPPAPSTGARPERRVTVVSLPPCILASAPRQRTIRKGDFR